MSVAEGDVRLMLGDCLEMMPLIPDQCIDVILCDPPYPEISRPYGRMTEAEWHVMMRGVVAESRRILKPSGSAVFILQPNSERAGKARLWLWEFMVWAGREWGLIQDVWWWNNAALPNGAATSGGMLRSSLKACVWLGSPDCHRDQSAVLETGEKPWMRRSENKVDERLEFPSGNGINRARCLDSVRRRGGTIPFNVIAMGNGHKSQMAGCHGHGAGTPMNLCDWWVRYLTPEGGTVCDPFMGSGTVGLAALKRGRKFVGIEKKPEYFATAQARIQQEMDKHLLFAGA